MKTIYSADNHDFIILWFVAMFFEISDVADEMNILLFGARFLPLNKKKYNVRICNHKLS